MPNDAPAEGTEPVDAPFGWQPEAPSGIAPA